MLKKLLLLALAVPASLSAQFQLDERQLILAEQSNVEKVIDKAVNYQMAEYGDRLNTDWKAGTFFTGLYAAYKATGNESYRQQAYDWCEKAGWKAQRKTFHADHICIAQTYLDIYQDTPEPKMIADIQSRLDQYFGKDKLEKHESGELGDGEFNGRNLWWWCDALYMAPPVMARMSQVTGDPKYTELMHELYWDTVDFLYRPEEGLFMRDRKYFNKKTGSGKPVFWARGNGWVYGGIVRIVDQLDKDDPMRQKYIDLYLELTKSLIKYQQEDGLWRASVNDPDWFPSKESTGSSFYCYGLLAGINRGWLDRETFLAPALAAWDGLLGCMNTDGRLGYAQIVGERPTKLIAQDQVDYAQGIFLLAAAELYNMNLTSEDFKKVQPKYEPHLLAKDSVWTWFNDERAVQNGQNLLLGGMTRAGKAKLNIYNKNAALAAFKLHEYELSSWTEKDDHNNPSFLFLNDEDLLIAYARHNSAAKWEYRRAKVHQDKRHMDVRLGEEKVYKTPRNTTYINLSQLSDENNRVYNFYRCIGWNPTVSWSDDGGETWSEAHEVLRSGDARVRPYVKYSNNGKDRIDLLYTDGHPRGEKTNSVYHIYYKGGKFHKSDGTVIGTMEDVLAGKPMVPQQGTKIYDGAEGGRGWVWDLEYGKDGAIHAASIRSNDHAEGLDLRYMYSDFDPKTKQWTCREIGFAGTRLYRGENHYAGGITVNPEDGNKVYISADVDPVTGKALAAGRYQLFEGTRSGEKWTWKQLTFDTQVDNLRPVMPRRRGESDVQTLVYFRGHYRTYRDYEVDQVGMFIPAGK